MEPVRKKNEAVFVILIFNFHYKFKTPKLYFYETGLVCHLLGIKNSTQLENHPIRGALFKNLVFSELTKKQLNKGQRLSFYFWRTHGGQEVDFIVEQGNKVHAIEVKSGMTVRPNMIRSLNNTVALWGKNNIRGWVIYGGTKRRQPHGIIVLPWKEIGSLQM